MVHICPTAVKSETKKLKSDQTHLIFLPRVSGEFCAVTGNSMAADGSPSSPPNILLIEQTLILKYLRGICASWGEVAPVIILFADWFFGITWRQIGSEKSNESGTWAILLYKCKAQNCWNSSISLLPSLILEEKKKPQSSLKKFNNILSNEECSCLIYFWKILSLLSSFYFLIIFFMNQAFPTFILVLLLLLIF